MLAALALALSTGAAAEPPAREPAWIVGYATAAVERADPLEPFAIELDGGRLTVAFERRPDLHVDVLLRQLSRIDGVEAAEIRVGGRVVARSPSGPGAGAAGRASVDPAGQAYDFFLNAELFDPLLADPRWPRFSASHLWFLGDEELERVGAANFGESFVFVRSPRKDSGQWELGFQAGVFSVFDLEASSADLVNSDFLVGLNATYHIGDFTAFLRIYHQSSHLGDEFLLRNRVDRVNLSFEVVDVLLSVEPLDWLRLYCGGGVIVHREPALERGILQAGSELSSPTALFGGFIRPLVSADLQWREESDWGTDLSIRGGVQLEHPFLRRSRVHVLVEYYDGRSPNGQFYERRIQTIGLGIHLGF